MGRTACTEPQCLYKGALYLTLQTESVTNDDQCEVTERRRLAFLTGSVSSLPKVWQEIWAPFHVVKVRAVLVIQGQ